MCWAAAIPVALTGLQSVVGQGAQEKARVAQIDAGRRQAMEMVREVNINNANSSMEQRNALDAAAAELTSRSMAKVQAMGTIRAAIGEGSLEGESMKRIQRIEEGKYIREANGVTENYGRDYASIFTQTLGRNESTSRQIKEIYRGEQKGRSKLMQVLDPVLSMGATAANSYISSGLGGGGKRAVISAAKGTKTGR